MSRGPGLCNPTHQLSGSWVPPRTKDARSQWGWGEGRRRGVKRSFWLILSECFTFSNCSEPETNWQRQIWDCSIIWTQHWVVPIKNWNFPCCSYRYLLGWFALYVSISCLLVWPLQCLIFVDVVKHIVTSALERCWTNKHIYYWLWRVTGEKSLDPFACIIVYISEDYWNCIFDASWNGILCDRAIRRLT